MVQLRSTDDVVNLELSDPLINADASSPYVQGGPPSVTSSLRLTWVSERVSEKCNRNAVARQIPVAVVVLASHVHSGHRQIPVLRTSEAFSDHPLIGSWQRRIWESRLAGATLHASALIDSIAATLNE